MNPLSLADLTWLPGNDLYWIIAAGIVVTTLAFLFATQLFSRSPGVESPPLPEGSQHDPFAKGGTTERRQAFRRKGSSISVKITDDKQAQSGWEGWVLDRSVNGLGLIAEKQAEAGTILRVRPENAPPMTPFIEIEVRSCEPYEMGWHLHCSFLKTPPYSVLLLFG